MKKTTDQMIDKINNILSSHQQKIRIVDWTGSTIILSDGQSLTRSDRSRFIRRITSDKTDLWAKNTDNLLSGLRTEKEIKSALSRIGGLSCQQKHGDKIKLNLNTYKSIYFYSMYICKIKNHLNLKWFIFYIKSIFFDLKISNNPIIINGILSHCPVENIPRSLSKPP